MYVDIYLCLAGPPPGEDPVTGMVEVSARAIFVSMSSARSSDASICRIIDRASFLVCRAQTMKQFLYLSS